MLYKTPYMVLCYATFAVCMSDSLELTEGLSYEKA